MTKKIGVADFGYDLYFLVIAELLNHKYLGLLNFYFHTLIQQRQKIYYNNRNKDC